MRNFQKARDHPQPHHHPTNAGFRIDTLGKPNDASRQLCCLIRILGRSWRRETASRQASRLQVGNCSKTKSLQDEMQVSPVSREAPRLQALETHQLAISSFIFGCFLLNRSPSIFRPTPDGSRHSRKDTCILQTVELTLKVKNKFASSNAENTKWIHLTTDVGNFHRELVL